MSLVSLAKLLGWIVVIGYVLALMNFFIKYINKKYINKLPKESKFKDNYRKLMRFIVKNHKIIGGLTSIIIIFHFIVMFVKIGVSVTGLIAFLIMILIFLLGIYGVYFNKNNSKGWVKIHRVLAFILLLAILFHLLF